jgi:lysozyme
MMIKGVDVYHGDGNIDWNRVCAAGYKFAFVKASQGTTIRDSAYEGNLNSAERAGVLVGAYHFFTPTSDAAAQAKWFLRCIDMENYNGMLPPVIDAEKRGGMSINGYTDSIRVWCNIVEDKMGVKPIIYASFDYVINYINHSLEEYPLWIAMWGTMTPKLPLGGWDHWVFWQNSANETVDGMPNDGDVDTDFFNGTVEDLKKLTIGYKNTTTIKIIDATTQRLIATHEMVPDGNHITDQKKIYVKVGT